MIITINIITKNPIKQTIPLLLSEVETFFVVYYYYYELTKPIVYLGDII